VTMKRLMVWWELNGEVAIKNFKSIKIIWIYFIFVKIRIYYGKN
jgi:hypothetical protein